MKKTIFISFRFFYRIRSKSSHNTFRFGQCFLQRFLHTELVVGKQRRKKNAQYPIFIIAIIAKFFSYSILRSMHPSDQHENLYNYIRWPRSLKGKKTLLSEKAKEIKINKIRKSEIVH